MRATSQKRGKNGTRDRSNARRHPKRAQKSVHRAFSRRSHSSSVFFFLDNIVTFYARERENPKDKTPTGDTHTQKKERENSDSTRRGGHPGVPRNYSVAENMFFRASDAVET